MGRRKPVTTLAPNVRPEGVSGPNNKDDMSVHEDITKNMDDLRVESKV
jgi:hypothetical protein